MGSVAVDHGVVYANPELYCGWPANHGAWQRATIQCGGNMSNSIITTSSPHGFAVGDIVTIDDMRRRPRFMPRWFYRLIWQRFQAPPRAVRIVSVSETSFTVE